jgi:hypothetical protein
MATKYYYLHTMVNDYGEVRTMMTGDEVRPMITRDGSEQNRRPGDSATIVWRLDAARLRRRVSVTDNPELIAAGEQALEMLALVGRSLPPDLIRRIKKLYPAFEFNWMTDA